MDSRDTAEKILMIGEAFRQAKVEHYLQRAEECIQMGRYLAARLAVGRVFELDPDNRSGLSLEKRINYYLASMRDRTQDAIDPAAEEGSTNSRARRNELVMLVDQDEPLLMSLTESLRRYGFQAVAASGYNEAIETLSEITPDMIVSEVNFENGPAGFDLYLWVRTNSSVHDMPFLFLATRIDRDTLIAGKRLGVNDFILKPLDDDVVIASIINCLSRKKEPR